MDAAEIPVKLPRKALTNLQLAKLAHTLKIPFFRGIFMRNDLPKKIKKYETGIINQDDWKGVGTHWTSYAKTGRKILYFDSIGHLGPPKEVLKYFRSDSKKNLIRYNIQRFQKLNAHNCGQLTLKFLYMWAHHEKFI